jgi:hypothetical protein
VVVQTCESNTTNKQYFQMTYIKLIAIISIFFLCSCNLESNIDIELPESKSQLVVECYLEHGKPYKLLLTETVSYLASATNDPNIFSLFNLPQVKEALIYITHNSRTIVLPYRSDADIYNRKVYNYISDELVDSTQKGDYTLLIKDTKGREITAKTRFLPKLIMQEVSWKFQADNNIVDSLKKASILVIHDKFSETQFQRLQIGQALSKRPNIDTLTVNKAIVDLSYPSFGSNNYLSIGTTYYFNKKDTLYVRLFNMEKQWYDYRESVIASQNANKSPFAQPTRIISGVEGGLGIFTTLVYDKKIIIIK